MIIGHFHARRRWLSNFYNSPTIYKNRWRLQTYMSVEHAYQANKATNKWDHDWIARAPGAALARSRGRSITRRGDFDLIKEWLMLRLVYAKFAPGNVKLRGLLIDTWPHELVHGNNHGDEFWGVSRRTGEGENRLGKLLMLIRDLIRDGYEDTIDIIARKKVKRVERRTKWKNKRRAEVAEANKDRPKLKSMAMDWQTGLKVYPSAAKRRKTRKVEDAINGMKGRMAQVQNRKDTLEFLKKEKR